MLAIGNDSRPMREQTAVGPGEIPEHQHAPGRDPTERRAVFLEHYPAPVEAVIRERGSQGPTGAAANAARRGSTPRNRRRSGPAGSVLRRRRSRRTRMHRTGSPRRRRSRNSTRRRGRSGSACCRRTSGCACASTVRPVTRSFAYTRRSRPPRTMYCRPMVLARTASPTAATANPTAGRDQRADRTASGPGSNASGRHRGKSRLR